LPNEEIAACLDTRREAASLWRKRFFCGSASQDWESMLVRVAPDFPPQERVSG